MKTLKFILFSVLLLAMELTAFAQKARVRQERETVVLGRQIERDTTRSGRSLKTYVIAPKGEWQVGATIAYMDLSTENSEFMLIANGSDASASVLRLAPNVAYTYCDNQAVGLKFQYTSANCAVDAATFDLLGNFSTSVSDIHARTRSYGGHVYNRSYIGLDNRGRVGLFMDTSLGYTRSKTVAYMGDPSDSYTMNRKFSLCFSPGATYYPMNNVSCYVAIGLADISYNRSAGYSNGEITGTRNFFRIQSSVNLLSLNFGLAIHL